MTTLGIVAIIVAVILAILSPLFFRGGGKFKMPSFGHWHLPHLDWGKWIKFILVIAFLGWTVYFVTNKVTESKPPPPPPKVYGPTEVLYILDIRNGEDQRVNFEGKRVEEPEKFFVVTVKSLTYFEGYYPRVNGTISPHKEKLMFSHSFGEPRGKWEDLDRNKTVKRSGAIQILRNSEEYTHDKVGVIRGYFWKEGLDPSSKEGAFSFSLYPPPPGNVKETRTVKYWAGK